MAAVEQKKSYAVVKDFKGINTKNNRTVIDDGEFGWLENAMPIGFGNLKIINGSDQLSNVTWSANVTFMGSVNITNEQYKPDKHCNNQYNVMLHERTYTHDDLRR